MKNTIILNFTGAPGAGKSTGAAYTFAKLKMLGIDAELATEFAKDKVWEENPTPFKNQAYIFGKQSYRLSRVVGKVEVIVTDSPLLLSIIYNNDERLTENFNETVKDVWNSYNNLTYFVHRVKPYNKNGRHQTEEESDALSNDILKLFEDNNVTITHIDGCQEDYDKVVMDVYHKLRCCDEV